MSVIGGALPSRLANTSGPHVVTFTGTRCISAGRNELPAFHARSALERAVEALVLRPLREWLFITERPARVLAGEAPRHCGAEAVREALGLALAAVGFGF